MGPPSSGAQLVTNSGYCTVPLPVTWAPALQHKPGSPSPLCRACWPYLQDGAEYFATAYSSVRSGVEAVLPASGKVVKVSRFPDPASSPDQVLSVALAGDWLVPAESHTDQDPVATALLAWNRHSQQVTTLFSAPPVSSASTTSTPADGEQAAVASRMECSAGSRPWTCEGSSIFPT